MSQHIPYIIAGLAIGAFVGYEWAPSVSTYPPYTWILSYVRSS